jgi:hypothetical protein
MKFFQIPDPFGDMPVEVRRAAVRAAAAKARATFEAEYPKIVDWFDTYDPLYLLSFCAYYFLTAPQGVDKEAIDGKLDFASFHLELLQAFALMRSQGGTPQALAAKAKDLKSSLKKLTDSLRLLDLDLPLEISDADLRKRMVLSQMRSQTFAVRNWAYPEQTLRHLKCMFSGVLSEIVAAEYEGVSIVRVIDALKALYVQSEDRLNLHISKLAPVVTANDFELVCARYKEAFPDIVSDREGMHKVFCELCRGDLEEFKMALVAHSDLRLREINTFSLDDAVRAYGEESCRTGLKKLLAAWSYEFGDLADKDPKHFIYGNPVLLRPFIRLGEEHFYWVLSGIYAHTLSGMLETLIPKDQRDRYSSARSKYLEDQTEAALRKAFPDGKIYRGSRFRLNLDDTTVYENDILVVIDSTAIVVECKSNLVDPPARRGAEFRLADTLEDLVVAAAAQAHRFADFLKRNPKRHAFETKSERINRVNASRLLRFIPISVTYENLGFVSSNLKELVAAGLIESEHPLVPSICLTDLEIVLETLDSQVERIHYLARRAEIERSMNYLGDELDLFAFYINTAFNIGEWERGGQFLSLGMMSKELDPYFVARADGVSVPKPRLRLTPWWRDILTRIEQRQIDFWTEIAYVFLSVGYEDQQKFEENFKKLRKQILSGTLRKKYNWVNMLSGTLSETRYGVLGFPYRGLLREERMDMMKHMAAEFEQETPVLGTVAIAVDIDSPRYPYDALLFRPGHAPGATDFSRMVLGSPDRPEVNFHLKDPRPRQ